MHIVILFYNLGGYHAARLRAARTIFQKQGWHLTALQVTDYLPEWPWGNINYEINFSIKTILSAASTNPAIDCSPSSTFPASFIPTCLDELKPDILAIPGWGFPVSRAALAWCQHHQVPTILMSESKWDDNHRQWWKEKLKYWLYVRKYDAAIVGGKLHRDYLIQLGFNRDRIFFGYDVVDNDYFTQGAKVAQENPLATRNRQGKIPAKPYFLAVTRLIKRKNVFLLVEAFAAYRQQVQENEAWDLVICGDGAEKNAIQNLIAEKNLNNCIHLPGFITYQAVVDWYGLASAFIHPASQEQWGLVVNEAMASGLPVLVSNRCGCFQELVLENVNGFGFDPDNMEELTNLMIKISDRQINLQAMSQAGIKHIQNFSPSQFGQGLLAAINSILAPNRKVK